MNAEIEVAKATRMATEAIASTTMAINSSTRVSPASDRGFDVIGTLWNLLAPSPDCFVVFFMPATAIR